MFARGDAVMPDESRRAIVVSMPSSLTDYSSMTGDLAIVRDHGLL